MICHFSKFCYIFRCKILYIELIRHAHTELKSELSKKIKLERDRIIKIRRQHKENELNEQVLHSMYSGLKGYNDQIWEISQPDINKGILFRGYSIEDLLTNIPKLPGKKIPTIEGYIWLLITGNIPSNDQMKLIMKSWEQSSIIPFFIEKYLRDSPPNKPAIELLSGAVNMLNSKVVESYAQFGVLKEKYWQMVLEDVMDLIAKVPAIAAMVYNKLYRHRPFLPMHNPNLDWAANFAIKMGIHSTDFDDAIRLFTIIYSHNYENKLLDHAMSGSAMSDPYKSYSVSLKMLNDAAASEFTGHNIIPFLENFKEQIGPNPTVETVKDFLSTKYSKRKLPGFRQLTNGTDKRYECLLNFSKNQLSSDSLFKTAMLVQQAVYEINKELKPNADLISPLLLRFYGLEVPFYPIMFSIARSLGVLTTYIWDRALGVSLEKNKFLNGKSNSTKHFRSDSKCVEYLKSKIHTNSHKGQDMPTNVSDSLENLK